MNQTYKYLSIIVISTFLLAMMFSPQLSAGPKGNQSISKTANKVDYVQFDGNRIAAWVRNNGGIVDYHKTGASGMEWPKGTEKTIDYQSGLWIAGKDADRDIRTACAEYSSEFLPGSILADGTPDDPDNAAYRIYKINKDGTGDWDVWPFDQGAPAMKDINGSDSLDADGNKIPGLIGDQTMFFVMNDADTTQHSNLFSTLPFGIEVQTTIFGFNRSDALGDIMFVQWKLINKSQNDYDSIFVSVWDDPDVGDGADDLVACDTSLSLGYCYNGLAADAMYGTAPPAIGFDFFQGPEVNGEYLPMSSFIYYWNGAPDPYGDPEDATQAYYFMQGFTNNGSPYLDPDGNPNRFVFSGDPISGVGWLDATPNDRRFLMSTGPFDLASGAEQVVVGAKIIAQGSSALSSIAALKYADIFAQNAFDYDFAVVNPPPPQVSGEALDQKVILTWDVPAKNEVIENYDYLNYKFEGYNVYQGASLSGPWTLLKTYDLNNANAVIYDDAVDATSGWIVNKPTAFGTNSGIYHHITITADAITGTPLYNYKTYYFAVADYVLNLDQLPKMIESGKTEGVNLIIIQPGDKADVELPAEADGDVLDVTHTAGVSTAKITVEVVNPAELTGHKYQFDVNQKIEAGDTSLVYDLMDTNTGLNVLTDQPLYLGVLGVPGTDDPPIVDGLKVYFIDTPNPGLANYDYDGTRWITGADKGLEYFFGGMDLVANVWGSTVGDPEAFPCTLKFKADTTSGPADGWQSYGYVYRRDLGYEMVGMGYLPFSAWDMTDPANPRQVNVCIIEDANDGNANMRWDMGGWDGTAYTATYPSGREYIIVSTTDYDPTGSTYSTEVDGTVQDALYFLWTVQRGTMPYLGGDFNFYFVANLPLTTDDVYEFTTDASVTGDEITKEKMDKINVVPNPYFCFNTAERTPTTRVIRITNLPTNHATIRIFDLAGNLVKSIDDAAREAQGTSGTAYAEWDARNASDVPVASGIYLVHIEIKDVGVKILKVAVINRDERLIYY